MSRALDQKSATETWERFCKTHCARTTADAEGEDDAFDCGQRLMAATVCCAHVDHAAADDDGVAASREH